MGGGGRGAPNYVVGPPTVERPPEAADFFLSDTLTGRTSANTPAVFPLATFQIPPNNVGVIRSISILANSLLVTSDIRWSLLFNDVPVTGWNSLTIAPRAAGSIESSFVPDETFIPIPEGSSISWSTLVVDAGTYQLSITYHGWFYPLSVAQRAANAYG